MSIKKDYRDILQQQFTTEQYYLDKIKEVFNSDTEFIKKFHLFLQELLVQVVTERIEKAYFMYGTGREDKTAEYNRVVYHMFDDTSCGLNNVYNVLLELPDFQAEGRADAKKDKRLLQWKRPRQSSRWILRVLIIGCMADVQISMEESAGKKGQADGCTEREEKAVFSRREKFLIFLLMDFIARLFLQNITEDTNYQELKIRIIEEYIQDETIDGKITVLRKRLYLRQDVDKREENKESIRKICLCAAKSINWQLHCPRRYGL